MTIAACPHAPVSWGELLDKISILQIKRERIDRVEARANVQRELEQLEKIAVAVWQDARILPLQDRLKAVNEALWEIEDAIRLKEREGNFGAEFVALARSVYKRNDERAAVKREMNRLLDSDLVEEKSYAEEGFLLANVGGGADGGLVLTAP